MGMRLEREDACFVSVGKLLQFFARRNENFCAFHIFLRYIVLGRWYCLLGYATRTRFSCKNCSKMLRCQVLGALNAIALVSDSTSSSIASHQRLCKGGHHHSSLEHVSMKRLAIDLLF